MKHLHKAFIIITLLLILLLAIRAVTYKPPTVEEMWREYERAERLWWLW